MSQLFVSSRTHKRSTSARLVGRVGVLLAATVCVPSFAIAPQHAKHFGSDNYDVRLHPQDAPKGLAAKLAGPKTAAVKQQIAAGRAELADRLPGLKITQNADRGIVGQMTNQNGTLSGAKGKPESTVKSFVNENAKLFGFTGGTAPDSQLKTKAAYKNPGNELNWVHLKQEIGGVPVFQSELKALVNEKGELEAVTNELAPGLTDEVLQGSASLSPEDAVQIAAANIGGSVKASALVRETVSDDQLTIDYKDGSGLSMVRSQEVIFPLAVGEAVRGYQIVLRYSGDMYAIVVDAESGDILFRKDLHNDQTQTASYLIYQSDSPAPGTPWNSAPNNDNDKLGCGEQTEQGAQVSQVVKTLISDDDPSTPFLQKASPNGWITDFENATKGNNVWSGLDQPPEDGIDQGVIGVAQYSHAVGQASGPSLFNRNFLFTVNPPPSDPPDQPAFGSMNDFNSAGVTNMFFWTNRYHDYLYKLGFTEAAGNFQALNFGRGGSEHDLVLAQGQDYSGTDNANFYTPPDGQSGIMQMYVFPDDPAGVRDATFDQQVMLHELTHGLSNRLIGNGVGLLWQQGRGMGEGWSDFYSLSIMSEFPDPLASGGKDQDPDKPTPSGAYLTKNFLGVNYDNYFYGIRQYPYSTNKNLDPLTFADMDPVQYSTSGATVPESPQCLSLYGAEVHNLGFMWATILWQARSYVMHSFESAGFSQLSAWKLGNQHMLQLVTDGLKLTPTQPTFVEARDSIINAALAQLSNPAGWTSTDSVNPSIAQIDEIQLWRGFADRGLGYGAVAPTRTDESQTEADPINYYNITRTGCPDNDPSFFVNPSSVIKNLKDDDSYKYALPGNFTFYGRTYTSIYINTNGSITFDGPDSTPDATLDHHFSESRISGLLCDLDGSTTQGTISAVTQGNVVAVTFKDIPETASIDPDTGMGNHNTFQILLAMDSGSFPGAFRVSYGTCEAQAAICGLSSESSPRGVKVTPETVLDDLSAYGPCNPEIPATVFTEAFDSSISPFDLAGLSLTWNYGTAYSWTIGPQESYATPLRALEAKAETTTGSQVINAGNTVLVHIPLESKFKKANLSNVLGLITPLTDGVDVIDPVSDYGNINAGSAGDGSDPFIIQLADTIPCGAQIRLKVDFTSDQGIVGVKDDVLITVGSGIGSPQGALSYPQGAPSGTIGAAYSASATSVQLSSATNMKASAYLKNSRTNEIYLGTSWNQNTKVLGIKRAQKGTTAAAIEAGDELTFDSVPIPDALSAGLQLTVFPTDPNIQGAIGKIKVNLGKFTHPHVQDLRMTLSNSQGYSAVLLENAKPKLDGSTVYQNITIDTSATLSVSTLDGLQDNTTYRPTGDLSVFNNPALDAHSTWTLTVADLSAPFAGDISSWSIELSPLVLCATPTVQSSNFSGGVSGWTPESYGPAAFMDMYYRPENNQGPASLVLNTKANDSIRVPGFRSPGVPLINYPNQVYRFHAYVVRSGQPNMQDQSQVPFMRIRANIGSVMTNIHDYFFGIVNLDAPAAPYGWQIMPSTDRNAPSHYWVDLDPVDAPSLYSDPNHVVTGYIENWSHFAQQQGNIEVVQTKMERYSAPGDDEGQVVCTYTPADLSNGIQYSANLANKTWASDVPYERPRITTSTAGVTLDSSRVPAVGPVSVATFDVTPQNKQETILKANKLYRVRYHISSNTPSSSNPVFRLRARSLRWIDANELVIGPSNFGTERDQLLGRQILPGPGTLNPSHRQGETQGGYYDQYVSSPAVIPTDVDFKTLRFGFDIFDFGYDGNGTDAQKNEGGRFTLDSIQVTEFPQR